MAGFGGGRSQMYTNVTGLNAVPPGYEMALQQQQAAGFDFQADLDVFTNTQFFDFDMAEMPEGSPPQGASGDADLWPMQGAFVDHHQQQQAPNFSNYNNSQVAQSGFQRDYPEFRRHNPTSSSPSDMSSASTPQADARSKPLEVTGDPEDVSRMAAEEDKRRRNTAASARFRVKKKQREQALEKSAKEMTDRVSYLEQRVQTLEMENKLLKDLITKKTGTEADAATVAVGAQLGDGKTDADKTDAGEREAEKEDARRKQVKLESKIG